MQLVVLAGRAVFHQAVGEQIAERLLGGIRLLHPNRGRRGPIE